jgi:hypothetical protein
MSAGLRRRLARLARLARLERRRGVGPTRFVLVRPGEPEPEARESELLFVMYSPAPSGRGCAQP